MKVLLMLSVVVVACLCSCSGTKLEGLSVESDLVSGVRLSFNFAQVPDKSPASRGPQPPAPPQPAIVGYLQGPPTYLTKGGGLRLEVHARTIEKLKAEGWVEAPRPEVNPNTHTEPQWKDGAWETHDLSN